MRALFENNIDELPIVLQNCKKNKSKIFFEFKHSNNLVIKQRNAELTHSQISKVKQVHIQLLSKDGYYIEGTSNRLYLSDVVSRLYQSLENILKTNKGHKVEKNINDKYIRSLEKIKAKPKYANLSVLEPEFFSSAFKEIYSKVDSVVKDRYNIFCATNYVYSFSMFGDSSAKTKEIDEVGCDLIFDIIAKHDRTNKSNITISLSPKEIKNRTFKVEEIVEKIEELATRLQK